MKVATALKEKTFAVGKKISQKTGRYFGEIARRYFFKLGKRFVVPDLKGQEQLPHIKIRSFPRENLDYIEEKIWYREKLSQLAKKLSETKKDLKTATRQIVLLNYQLNRAGIIFENLKREVKEKNLLLEEKELEIELLEEVIANYFVEKAMTPAPALSQSEKPYFTKEILPKRERLMLKAEEYDLPKTAKGFGGKKTVFSDNFLEGLFENRLRKKLIKRLVVLIKDFCLNGPGANKSFKPHPLNGKVRKIPTGTTIVNLTDKYRLIFKIEKNDLVFHELRHRDDSTYR